MQKLVIGQTYKLMSGNRQDVIPIIDCHDDTAVFVNPNTSHPFVKWTYQIVSPNEIICYYGEYYATLEVLKV